jgi:hypothetical protein
MKETDLQDQQDKEEEKPGVLSHALAAFTLYTIAKPLFEVGTDASRPAPLLDVVVFIIVAIAGVVFIAVLIGLLAGKEIDDEEAIENPSWSLRAKFAFAVLLGMAAMFGILFAYMFWLTG